MNERKVSEMYMMFMIQLMSHYVDILTHLYHDERLFSAKCLLFTLRHLKDDLHL